MTFRPLFQPTLVYFCNMAPFIKATSETRILSCSSFFFFFLFLQCLLRFHFRFLPPLIVLPPPTLPPLSLFHHLLPLLSHSIPLFSWFSFAPSALFRSSLFYRHSVSLSAPMLFRQEGDAGSHDCQTERRQSVLRNRVQSEFSLLQ